MKTTIAILAAALAAVNSQAWAEGLPITPGMWETTTVIENSVTGNRTDTRKDCIKEKVLDPASQMQDMPKDQCTLDTKVDGNSMTYNMECKPPQGGTMTFNGRMRVAGDTMEGSMRMQGEMAGQSMTMVARTTGKRLGDC